MVSIKAVRASISTFSKTSPPGLVALSVGGTSGIGKGTLKQFVKNANAPKAYIVGRSKAKATPLLEELQSLNPQGTYIFLETEISLIKNVDTICDEIKAKEQKLDYIFVSTGYLTLEGRKETSEGIDTLAALDYYSRLRIIHNLLPLLRAATLPRVISVLGGGGEEKLNINDIELRNDYSLIKAAGQYTTQNTLAFEELAKSNPTITFSHVYPGLVNTGQLGRFAQTASGIWWYPAELARWTLIPLIYLFAKTADEAGEYGLFEAISAKYPPAEPKNPEEVGVALPKGVTVTKSSVVTNGKGNGVYRLGSNAESSANAKSDKILADLRSEGLDKANWDKTLAIWERALAA